MKCTSLKYIFIFINNQKYILRTTVIIHKIGMRKVSSLKYNSKNSSDLYK